MMRRVAEMAKTCLANGIPVYYWMMRNCRFRACELRRSLGETVTTPANAQPQHQHHPLLNAAVRSPKSPTYSLCGSRLRWINTVEQLLLGVPYSHRPALSVLTHTKRELCNVNGKALSRRQLCHRNRDYPLLESSIFHISRSLPL